MITFVTDYLHHLSKVLNSLDIDQINNVVKLIKEANNIYVIGNGGSSALSDHFVVDLIKFGNKKAYSLSSPSLYSMLVNDYGHSHSFKWVVDKLCVKNDLVIGITTSGKSENILRALIGNNKIKSVLMTGKSGKKIAQEMDGYIVVDDTHTQTLEDVFSILCHMISIRVGEEKQDNWINKLNKEHTGGK